MACSTQVNCGVNRRARRFLTPASPAATMTSPPRAAHAPSTGSSSRLDRRVVRAGALAGAARGLEHGGVLHLGPRRAVVAGRRLDGGHHLQHRHAEPGHRTSCAKGGVAGNWAWWAFLLTGMTTVFFYARLWRRLGVLTDLEFYELRYSGPAATLGARLPRGLPRRRLQRRDHGVGQPGRGQDRQRAARLADGPDAARLRRAQRRVCRDLRAVGRARHRLHPVRHRDGRARSRRRTTRCATRRSAGSTACSRSIRPDDAAHGAGLLRTGRWRCRSSSSR